MARLRLLSCARFCFHSRLQSRRQNVLHLRACQSKVRGRFFWSPKAPKQLSHFFTVCIRIPFPVLPYPVDGAAIEDFCTQEPTKYLGVPGAVVMPDLNRVATKRLLATGTFLCDIGDKLLTHHALPQHCTGTIASRQDSLQTKPVAGSPLLTPWIAKPWASTNGLVHPGQETRSIGSTCICGR